MIVYIGGLLVAGTPLVLGLVALLLGRKEDYPEILRSVFWRRGRHLCLRARPVQAVTQQLDVAPSGDAASISSLALADMLFTGPPCQDF